MILISAVSSTTDVTIEPIEIHTFDLAGLVDAIWDELLSGHTTAGSAGKAVADIETDATAILDDTGTSGVVLADNAITRANTTSQQRFRSHQPTAARQRFSARARRQRWMETRFTIESFPNTRRRMV